ncbi:MAG TPA: response regulator [Bacteroidetes bacterium]|nr:response regulator [Bacteroidota bacterium]
MKTVDILLVEDNEGDILLTKEVLDESKIINSIRVLRNGKEAIDFLTETGISNKKALPDIILLDINLPLKSGHEVLEEIKNHSGLMHIPVIMLTTSSSEKDVLSSYKNHANCYITKPVDVQDFLNAITSLEQFWLNIVKLPDA